MTDEEYTLNAEGYALNVIHRGQTNVRPHQNVHFRVVGEVMQKLQCIDPKPQETAQCICNESKSELHSSSFLHLHHIVLGIMIRKIEHRFHSSIQNIGEKG